MWGWPMLAVAPAVPANATIATNVVSVNWSTNTASRGSCCC